MARTKSRTAVAKLRQANKDREAKANKLGMLATQTSAGVDPNTEPCNVTTSTSLLGGGFTSKADRKRKRAASSSDSDNPLSLRAFETPRASRIKKEPVSDDESVVEIPEPNKAVTQPKKKVKVEPVRDEEELNPLDALEKALGTPILPASGTPAGALWFASNDHSDYDPALSDSPAKSAPEVAQHTAEKEPVTSDGPVISVSTFSKENGWKKVGGTEPSLVDLSNNPKTRKQLKAERKEAEEAQKQSKEQGQETEDRGDLPPARAATKVQKDAIKAHEDILKAKKERQILEGRHHMQKWPRERLVTHVHGVLEGLALEKLRQSRDLSLVEEGLQLALNAVRYEQKKMDEVTPEEQERLEKEIEARDAQIKQERKARKQERKARKQAEKQEKKTRDKAEKQEKKTRDKAGKQEKKTRDKAGKQIEKAEKAIKKAQSKEFARKAAEKKEKRAERLEDETKAIEKEMEELSKKIKKEKVDGPKKIKKEAKVMVKQEPRD